MLCHKIYQDRKKGRTPDITCVNETKIPVPIDKRCERECNREKRTVHIKNPISQLIYEQFPGRTLQVLQALTHWRVLTRVTTDQYIYVIYQM